MDLLSGLDVGMLVGQAKEFVHEHGMKFMGGVIISIASSIWGWVWGWRKWRSRQDMGVIHYSQNMLENRPTGPAGKSELWLVLDTYAENQLKDEISHPVARRLIRKAAARTTANQPFLVFDDADRWYVLNIIRLAIAEQFRAGAAAKMAPGAKVVTVECVFALTYERYTGMKQGKIRVMVAPRSMFDDPLALYGPVQVESPSHADRVTTLRKMSDDWKSGTDGGKWKYCQTVRINVQV